MNPSRIGIVSDNGALGLSNAATSLLDIEARPIAPEKIPSDLGLITLDVPLAERAAGIARIARSGYAGPVVAEMPLASSVDNLRQIEGEASNLEIWAVNPLYYQVHTRRILKIIENEDDPVTAIFAAWRTKPEALRADMLIQLLDYLSGMVGDIPSRLEAVNRDNPRILLGLARMPSGAVAHMEIGEHLPRDHPQPQELVVEVFRRESVLHVDAFRQAVTVESINGSQSVDWSPHVGVAVLRDVLSDIASDLRPADPFASERALHALLPAGVLADLGRES